MDKNDIYNILGFSESEIYNIIKNKSQYYESFEIKKKSGYTRKIDSPTGDLKLIQKVILNRLLYSFNTHKLSFGFTPNKSRIDSAKLHINKKVLYCIDLKDFFGTITKKRIYGLLINLGYNQEVSELLTKLITYKNKLPQGSPTSPQISNMILFRLDKRLNGLSIKYNLNYSRYADDITFSGDKIILPTIRTIDRIIKQEGFKVQRDKTRILSQKNRQNHLGFILNDKLSFGRNKYRKLKSLIHNCKTKGVETQTDLDLIVFRNKLFGNMAILKEIDPWKWYILKTELNLINWNEFQDKIYNEVRNSDNYILKEILFFLEEINKESGIIVFKITPEIISDLNREYSTVEFFSFRLQKIYEQLICKINIKFFLEFFPFEEKIKSLEKKEKSLTIIDKYFIHISLDGSNVKQSFKEIQIFAMIYARHQNKTALRKAKIILTSYNMSLGNENFEKLFEIILTNFRNALKDIFYSLKK